jgi:hypothetical protein
MAADLPTLQGRADMDRLVFSETVQQEDSHSRQHWTQGLLGCTVAPLLSEKKKRQDTNNYEQGNSDPQPSAESCGQDCTSVGYLPRW